MRAHHTRSIHNGIGSNYSEDKAAIAVWNNQTRARFYLLRFAELRESGGARPANHFTRRTQRRSRNVQIILVVVGKILNLGALCGSQQKPRRFFLSPGVSSVLRAKGGRKS